MPIIWRYLFWQYLKVISLSVATFIAILFVSRLKQLADFAAMGAGTTDIFIFALYLIPYVLPYAIPISCLIASIILYQRLSNTHELTAMRASGLGLRKIIAPIMVAGVALSLVNFYVSSELATHCHMLSRRMEVHVKTVNPLLLLQNSRLLKLGELFVDMRTVNSGQSAEDLTLVARNANSGRLTLIAARQLIFENERLTGRGVSLVASLPSHQTEGFDHLLIDCQAETETPSDSFSHLAKQMSGYLKNSHLRLALLLIGMKEDRGKLQEGIANGAPKQSLDVHRHNISKSYSEIVRRISLGASAFTFTLLGCAYGIHISRRQTKRGLISVLALATFYIASFSIGNGLDHHLALSATLLLGPLLLILVLCIWTLKRVTRGVE